MVNFPLSQKQESKPEGNCKGIIVKINLFVKGCGL